jgi:hypothetical protein
MSQTSGDIAKYQSWVLQELLEAIQLTENFPETKPFNSVITNPTKLIIDIAILFSLSTIKDTLKVYHNINPLRPSGNYMNHLL